MASVWHENGHAVPLQDDELRQVALGMLKARRAMRGTLPAALIHDVALEILLTAYLCHDGTVTAEQLTFEATVPASLVQRWLAAVASEELIVIVDEKVSLTTSGAAHMANMLTSVVQSQRDLLGWAQH